MPTRSLFKFFPSKNLFPFYYAARWKKYSEKALFIKKGILSDSKKIFKEEISGCFVEEYFACIQL